MLPNQAAVLTEEQNRRHEMRPGVTGWAQVNGRNNLSWGEKIVFDIDYIQNFNFWFDIKILFKTVAVVLKKDGIQFRDGDTLLNQGAKSSEKETTEVK
jgi:lipopolysaccharide/colanic/teichoic acid biosynthesis glycosyltransferase